MSIWEIEGKKVSLLTGAPEVVFDFCQIDEEKKKKYSKILDEWAEEGLRVLAFAKKGNYDLKEKKGL
jgi:magnesium-transporting ATPase (P-type)